MVGWGSETDIETLAATVRTPPTIDTTAFAAMCAAIRAPTLVIQGDRDFAVSPDGARRWAEILPDARLIMLSGAGHLAYIERSDRVLPALSRFFAGTWPPEAMQLRTRR